MTNYSGCRWGGPRINPRENFRFYSGFCDDFSIVCLECECYYLMDIRLSLLSILLECSSKAKLLRVPQLACWVSVLPWPVSTAFNSHQHSLPRHQPVTVVLSYNTHIQLITVKERIYTLLKAKLSENQNIIWLRM